MRNEEQNCCSFLLLHRLSIVDLKKPTTVLFYCSIFWSLNCSFKETTIVLSYLSFLLLHLLFIVHFVLLSCYVFSSPSPGTNPSLSTVSLYFKKSLLLRKYFTWAEEKKIKTKMRIVLFNFHESSAYRFYWENIGRLFEWICPAFLKRIKGIYM